MSMGSIRLRSVLFAALLAIPAATRAQEPVRLDGRAVALRPTFPAEGRPYGFRDGEEPAAMLSAGGNEVVPSQVAYSPDGKTLAVADGPSHPICSFLGRPPTNENGGLIRLLDAATGRVRLTLRPEKRAGHESSVDRLAFSPDGATLVSVGLNSDPAADAGEAPNFTAWDATTGRVLARVVGAGGRRWPATAIGPDARTVVAGTPDGLRAWDPTTGRPRFAIGEARHVEGVAFSPDGKLLAVGDGGRLLLADAVDGRVLARFPAHELRKARVEVDRLAFSPDGRTLAAAGFARVDHDRKSGRWTRFEAVRLVDVPGRSERATITGRPDETFEHLAFSPDGKTLATGGIGPGRVGLRLWSAADGNEQPGPTPNSAEVYDLAYSPDGSLLAAIGHAEILLIDAATGKERARLPVGPSYVFHGRATFSPDGRSVAAIAGGLAIWDLAAAFAPRPDDGHLAAPTCLAYAPDGKTLASGGADRTVKLWDLAARRPRATLRGHGGDVIAVAYAPDGSTVASADRGGVIKVWDAADGADRRTIRGRAGEIGLLAFTPDGRTIFAAGRDEGKVVLESWDVATGRPVDLPAFRARPVDCLAVSPGGKLLAVAAPDRAVTAWDPAVGPAGSGRRLAVLPDFHSLAMAPGGRSLAIVGQDFSVALWEPGPDGAYRGRTLKAAESSFTDGHLINQQLAFSPDGRLLASTVDGSLRLWETAPDGRVGALPGGPVAFAFSPDGASLAVDLPDHSLAVWSTDALLSRPPARPGVIP